MDDVKRFHGLQRRGVGLVDERGGGAFFERARDMVVAVVVVALERDEEIAGDQCARIDRDAVAPRRNASGDARVERRREPQARP